MKSKNRLEQRKDNAYIIVPGPNSNQISDLMKYKNSHIHQEK